MPRIVSKHIFLDEIVEHFVAENAAIWNADEEQYFFQWQVVQIDSGKVFLVETPHALSSENAIPN